MSRETREQARRLSWLTEAQAAVGWGIILVLAALLGTIYLRQASQIAAVGRRVQTIQIDLEDTKRENAELERQIAEAQSLERLQQEAIRLGFTIADPEDIEYIIVPDYPVAAEIDTAATAALSGAEVAVPTPAPPLETMNEALWLQLQNRIDSLIRGEAGE